MKPVLMTLPALVWLPIKYLFLIIFKLSVGDWESNTIHIWCRVTL